MKRLGPLLVVLALVSCAPQPTPEIVEVTVPVEVTVLVTQPPKVVRETVLVTQPPKSVEVTVLVTQPPLPTHTPYPTYTPQLPLPTYTPYPTHTPLPEPTATPKPTATLKPTPTPTSSFRKWTSQQVIEEFQAEGLETGEVEPFLKSDAGLVPQVFVEATHFYLPSLCEDCGGRVFSFMRERDLQTVAEYYEAVGEIFFTWIFVKDNILVQINGDLPEELAREYEAALQSMRK